MAAAVSKNTEVEICREDQIKINTFAKKNHKMQELKDELKAKKKDLQNLDDAESEIMMLDDEDAEMIPMQVGEIFVFQNMDITSAMLEKAKTFVNEEIVRLESDIEAVGDTLKTLKVQLYAKFGENINLEED